MRTSKTKVVHVYPGKFQYRDLGIMTFVVTWLRLEKMGACDDFGGSESTRIFREWDECDMPVAVEDFIRTRANQVPTESVRAARKV